MARTDNKPERKDAIEQSVKLTASFMIVASLVCSGAPIVLAQSTQTVETRIGKLEFELGVPTKATVENLYGQIDFQRSSQLYIWALPIVGAANLQAILQGTTGALPGDLTIYTGNLQSVFLAPNAITPYLVSYLDLAKTGPVVMDIPAGAIAGSAMDFWQRPLADLGLTGPDQGKGGKYIFIGPGQESPTAEGAFIFRSPTFGVILFYRTLDPDQAKGEALAERIRVYPWAQRDNPPTTTRLLKPDPEKFAKFVTMPSGMKYWEQLAAVLEREPVEDRDRFFMAWLQNLVIQKGKPFQPDARQTKILTEGVFVGEAMAKALSFSQRFAGSFYRPDANWVYILMLDPMQDLPNYSQFDRRAAYFYQALGVTKGMISQTPGEGQAYLVTYSDKEGQVLDGAKTYRLHVPPNPPAKQFWSVTGYDIGTRSIILNKENIAVLSSRDDLLKNADGSIDIYLQRMPKLSGPMPSGAPGRSPQPNQRTKLGCDRGHSIGM
jgi:hypothetical protein